MPAEATGTPRIDPGPGQESVWDYPRPPRIEPSDAEVTVEVDGLEIARSRHAIRVLETGSPPAWYIPPEDVRLERIVPETGTTTCPWKGTANAYGIRTDAGVRASAAWCYPEPLPGFEPIARYLAFYPARVDRCTVNGEVVDASVAAASGGWVTSSVVGPFRGDPGTEGW
ncbi:MAG: DUF427 domain-containing protein [Thermomicrobiales bacterium]